VEARRRIAESLVSAHPSSGSAAQPVAIGQPPGDAENLDVTVAYWRMRAFPPLAIRPRRLEFMLHAHGGKIMPAASTHFSSIWARRSAQD